MSDTAPQGPTTEVGYQGITPPPWSMILLDYAEDAPALRWPTSIKTYHTMRADSQVDALTRSIVLPIRRKRWVIDPNGARDEVVAQVAADMALPIQGTDEDTGRGRRRFNHDEHLRMALLALWYGFMFFEQVGDIEGAGNDQRWRMTGLSPRMPQSIQAIGVANNGDLEGITQWGMKNQGVSLTGGRATARGSNITRGPWAGPDPIPAKQLAPYVWEREGSNWFGRSMLRSLYRHWLLKDRLIRIDAMKNERYGVGIPKATAPKGTRDLSTYGQLAQGVRAGDNTGIALPNGADLYVEGIRGQLPDTIASIQYHDAAMARAFLAMFIELGQTATGSRALGHTFVDFFDMSIEAICLWYATTTNESVVEDMVDWNWGEDEQAPLVTWEEDEHAPATATDLVGLVSCGLLTVDTEVEGWIRERYGAPPMMEGETQVTQRITKNPAVAPPALPAAEPVAAAEPPGLARRPRKAKAHKKRDTKSGKFKEHKHTKITSEYHTNATAGTGRLRTVAAALGRWDPTFARTVEAAHYDALHGALGNLIDVKKAVTGYNKLVKARGVYAAGPDEQSAIDDAIGWLTDNADMSLDDATAALQTIYQHGYVAGNVNATSALGMKSDVSLTDWQSAAKLLGSEQDGSGLKTMLDSAGITIKSVADNRIDDLGRALGLGVLNGDSPSTITATLQEILDDPSWADTITVTETNRAMSGAALDRYGDAGVAQKEWQTAAGDTEDECADNEDEGPIDMSDSFPSGDDAPPAHPNCRCVVLPVLSADDGSSDDGGDTGG